MDLNQAALFGPLSPTVLSGTIASILDAEVPVLLAASDEARHTAPVQLEAAGFRRLPAVEHLFWMAGTPEDGGELAFEVKRVRGARDVDAMVAMFQEVHGYSESLVGPMWGGACTAQEGTSGWLAWDGDEAVSFATVTEVDGSLSLFDVMTPLRHRRRGAGRAVVSAALAAVAREGRRPIGETLFWSSPAGRPLYEAMGFTVADDIDAWALGASQSDLEAVGA